MRALPVRLTVALCLVSLVACTTVRPVAERGAAPLSAQQVGTSIARGDKLTITTVDNSMTQMTVTNVLPDAIEGSVAGAGGAERIRIDQIRKIERREIDGVKTTLLGVGIFVILGLAIQSSVPYQP